MVRSRLLWPLGAVHSVHALHSFSTQSTGFFAQSGSQYFVSTKGPWQGTPHSFCMSAMKRPRLHKPMQLASLHSPHWEKVQSLAMHAGPISLGHVFTDNSMPVQRLD
jgi:hypothetical protein